MHMIMIALEALLIL